MAADNSFSLPSDVAAKTSAQALQSLSGAEARSAQTTGAWAWLRNRYFSVDRRLLGIFRISFGLLLLADLLRRWPMAAVFYSNEGVLSNHFSLFQPLTKPYFSLYTAFSSPGEVHLAFALTALVYVGYLVGYRTRVFQILAFVLVTSLNTRNLLLADGGSAVMSLAAAWTLFLPLGERFSIDALRTSLHAQFEYRPSVWLDRTTPLLASRAPWSSLAVFAILLQLLAIYVFTAFQCRGTTWTSGEAVHLMLWQNRTATALASWLRHHEPSWLSPLLTRLGWGLEGIAIPGLLLMPFAQRIARVLLFVLVLALHLGTALVLDLGPFPYALIALNLLFLPSSAVDHCAAWLRQGKAAKTLVYEPTDAALHHIARVLARMDSFHLLTFAAKGELEGGLAETAPRSVLATYDAAQQRWAVGTAALLSAIASLPSGRPFALLFSLAPLRAALRELLRRRGLFAELFRWRPGLRPDEPGPDLEQTVMIRPWVERLRAVRAGLREAGAAVFLLACVIQALHDNPMVLGSLRITQPAMLAPLVLEPHLVQSWALFAPDVPREDGRVVVDATTRDGRHMDPLMKGAPPDLDAPLHGPWHRGRLWDLYWLRIHEEQNQIYRNELKKYLLQGWQKSTGHPEADQPVTFEAWWVSAESPKPGSTTPETISRAPLFSAR